MNGRTDRKILPLRRNKTYQGYYRAFQRSFPAELTRTVWIFVSIQTIDMHPLFFSPEPCRPLLIRKAGQSSQKNINQLHSCLARYIEAYIFCPTCHRPNTTIGRNHLNISAAAEILKRPCRGTRLYFKTCRDCGVKRPAAPLPPKKKRKLTVLFPSWEKK